MTVLAFSCLFKSLFCNILQANRFLQTVFKENRGIILCDTSFQDAITLHGCGNDSWDANTGSRQTSCTALCGVLSKEMEDKTLETHMPCTCQDWVIIPSIPISGILKCVKPCVTVICAMCGVAEFQIYSGVVTPFKIIRFKSHSIKGCIWWKMSIEHFPISILKGASFFPSFFDLICLVIQPRLHEYYYMTNRMDLNWELRD